MTSLLSDITKRAEGLAEGKPTMDSHESLYRAVLLAIQGGAANPQELIAAALKADTLPSPVAPDSTAAQTESTLAAPQGSDLSTLTEALDKVGIKYLLKNEDNYWFLFISPRVPLDLFVSDVLVEDVPLEALQESNRYMEFDEDGSIASY